MTGAPKPTPKAPARAKRKTPTKKKARKRKEPTQDAAAQRGWRVLVAGATTPLGEQVVHELLSDPRIQHVLAVGAKRRDEGLPFPDSTRLTFVQADLSRSRERRRLMFGPARDLRIDTVVEAAQHRRASKRGARAYALNVEAARHLLRLSETHPTIRHYILRSYGEVYDVEPHRPTLIDESYPLDLTGRAPQYVRDRVEADLSVCTRMGMSPLRIVVLRLAEVFWPDCGSQLYDYLQSRVCFRPLGYDPMLNLLSLYDAAHAVHLSIVHDEVEGTFNIPGADTLPLARAVHLAGRLHVMLPGALLHPLYRARARFKGTDFDYGLNQRRFHFSGVLNGRRALTHLGYRASQPIAWSAHADDEDARRDRVGPIGPAPAED